MKDRSSSSGKRHRRLEVVSQSHSELMDEAVIHMNCSLVETPLSQGVVPLNFHVRIQEPIQAERVVVEISTGDPLAVQVRGRVTERSLPRTWLQAPTFPAEVFIRDDAGEDAGLAVVITSLTSQEIVDLGVRTR